MWNDKETDVDLLGHDKLAQTVIEIIQDNHLRPLTIGIYGDWGVGKSSILALLQKKITEANAAQVSNAHYISFNGWLFQGYEDAKSALMETVVSELANLQPRSKKIQKIAKSLIKRVNWLKVARVGAGALVTGLTGIPDPGILSGAVNLYKRGKDFFDGAKEDSSTAVTVNTEEDSFLKEYEEKTITGQILAFRKEFRQLIEFSKVDHVIVLVDDLDRCLPKSVIEILEAIRLFLFVEGTTFVLSADEKMIEYAVREHFPNLPASYSDYTKSYLEKLIQIPIRIPLLNRLQTGNYIKFLLLQHHLKHDYGELARIYEFYNSKKKKPYDPIDLTYEVITEALGETNTKLSETILVGDQLTPTLSAGLKGNPRNIKRFLNTLFLRMRIARIYGLDSEIQLSVLAKLMLLERFQPEQFTSLVDEVSVTKEGVSATIKKLEANDKAIDSESAENTTAGDNNVDKLQSWIKIEPQLSDVNLHPYIFISREKAIGFDTDNTFPEDLQKLLEQLSSGSDMLLQTAEKALSSLSPNDAGLLFSKLEAESRTVSDVKNIPIPIKGLLRIIRTHPEFEVRIIDLVKSYPVSTIGVWAIAQLTGIRTPEGKKAWATLLDTYSKQDENKTIKTFALQTLNK